METTQSLFFSILLLLLLGTVLFAEENGSTPRCPSPQCGKMGEIGIIKCNFTKLQFNQISWLMKGNNDPVVRLEKGADGCPIRLGEGYEQEIFDALLDGYLLIYKVGDDTLNLVYNAILVDEDGEIINETVEFLDCDGTTTSKLDSTEPSASDGTATIKPEKIEPSGSCPENSCKCGCAWMITCSVLLPIVVVVLVVIACKKGHSWRCSAGNQSGQTDGQPTATASDDEDQRETNVDKGTTNQTASDDEDQRETNVDKGTTNQTSEDVREQENNMNEDTTKTDEGTLNAAGGSNSNNDQQEDDPLI